MKDDALLAVKLAAVSALILAPLMYPIITALVKMI